MGLELLFLLLPVAALSGWILGRRRHRTDPRQESTGFSSEYFKGLNFLLNEQPDKAIEVFVRMVEVDSETIDTHLALGNLFRRRGEVERAIRIHQNLIARPILTRPYRNQALYELGLDYMRAGLLDRAEALFLQLIDDQERGEYALRQLLDVYQQEKEWDNAIKCARRLESATGEQMAAVVAQFYCELAEESLRADDIGHSVKMVKQALSEDRTCVRASLLEGRIHLRQGAYKSAMRALKRVEQQDAEFLPEILEPIQEAYRGQGRPMEMIHYLRPLLREHGGISVLLRLVDLIRQQQGDKDAALFITDYLRKRPSVRGMERLIELKLPYSPAGPAREDLQVLKDLTSSLLRDKPVYKCNNCGFTGKQLHWQCPSCKRWNTIRPIHGIEGE